MGVRALPGICKFVCCLFVVKKMTTVEEVIELPEAREVPKLPDAEEYDGPEIRAMLSVPDDDSKEDFAGFWEDRTYVLPKRRDVLPFLPNDDAQAEAPKPIAFLMTHRDSQSDLRVLSTAARRREADGAWELLVEFNHQLTVKDVVGIPSTKNFELIKWDHAGKSYGIELIIRFMD